MTHYIETDVNPAGTWQFTKMYNDLYLFDPGVYCVTARYVYSHLWAGLSDFEDVGSMRRAVKTALPYNTDFTGVETIKFRFWLDHGTRSRKDGRNRPVWTKGGKLSRQHGSIQPRVAGRHLCCHHNDRRRQTSVEVSSRCSLVMCSQMTDGNCFRARGFFIKFWNCDRLDW